MNTWLLPLITNSVLALTIMVGFLLGRRNGWKFEFIKLLLLIGVGAGLYFLSPILTELLLTTELATNLITALTYKGYVLDLVYITYAINSLIYVLLFIICLIIITAALKSIRKTIYKKRLHTSDKKVIKEQFRRTRRLRSKANKNIGGIFSLVSTVLILFLVFMPVKYTSKIIVDNKPELEIVENVYESSAYAYIDEHTNVYNLVNGDKE